MNVEMSYYEIYNEKIHDLLAGSNVATPNSKDPFKEAKKPNVNFGHFLARILILADCLIIT